MREAYYCGHWIPESELAIAVSDLGFAMGVTVTERLRTVGGEVFRKQEHLDRMQRSLDIVGFSAGAMVAQLGQAIDEYLNRHRDQIEPGDDWAIIAFVTPGDGRRPTLCVHGRPLPFGEWADDFTTGVHLRLSDHRQVPPNCWPAELKCRSRMHYYLADRQARRADPQARAVLLDQEGYVAEASTANLVVYDSLHGLRTPRFSKVLHGVSVMVVEELAQQLGVPYREDDITVAELAAADEAWLTSTSICMLPVASFEGQAVGAGRPGAMYTRFLAAWSELIGVDIAHQARRFANRGGHA